MKHKNSLNNPKHELPQYGMKLASHLIKSIKDAIVEANHYWYNMEPRGDKILRFWMLLERKELCREISLFFRIMVIVRCINQLICN